MKVTKQFIFHAAHRDELADDECGRLHGHTYKLELSASGAPTATTGMVLHGDVLKTIYRERIEPLVEHQYLNETLPINPTMEHLAAWCLIELQDALDTLERYELTGSVRVWETPTMFADAP